MTYDLTVTMVGPIDTDAARIMSLFPQHPDRKYDDATVAAFAGALLTHAQACGLRPSLIAAQIAKETAHFRFGGQVQAGQYNLAGLGATNGGAAGMSYPDIYAGVAAVCAHHLTYIYGDAANWPPHLADWYLPLDKRHDAVISTGKGGTVKILSDYRNGWWAYTPSIPEGSLLNGYATGILELANTIADAESPAPPAPGGTHVNIIDIRDQLAHADGQGDGRTFGPKQGAIIHYSAVNYPADRPILDILQSEALFHTGPYLREYSLAYHYSVDPQTGEVYQCRDEDAVCWHCGAWPENMTWYSIHVPGGPALEMSAAGVAGLAGLLAMLAERDGYDPMACKGHQEVSATSCPGPLMEQFVRPWRAGEIAHTAPTPTQPPAGGRWFEETGHLLAGGFLTKWTNGGGLDEYGFPLSEEMQDGGRTVQYFQRAVFEYWPEKKGTPYEVQLRLVGTEAAKRAGLHGLGIS